VVHQVVLHRLRTGEEATHGREGLRERAGDQVDLIREAEVRDAAATRGSDRTDRVRFVDEDPAAVLLAEATSLSSGASSPVMEYTPSTASSFAPG
jgi:hypothetical protein